MNDMIRNFMNRNEQRTEYRNIEIPLDTIFVFEC